MDRHPLLELELVRRVEVLGPGGRGREQRKAQHREQCLPEPHPVFASPPTYEIIEIAELDRERDREHDGGLETEGGVPRGDDDENRHQHDRAEHPTHGHEAAVAELIHPDRETRQ